MNNSKRILILLLFSFFFISFQSSCLLDRLIQLKKQLCSFEKNFHVRIHPDGSLSFIAVNPVLLDKDIIKLTGEYPSKKEIKRGRLAYKYIFRKKDTGSDKQYDLSTTFFFKKLKRRYRLEEVYLDRNVTTIFSSKFVSDVLKSLCKSERNIPARRFIINLKNVDLKLLPDLEGIEKILGKHNRIETVDKKTDLYTYIFLQEFVDPLKKKIKNKSIVKAYYNKKTKSLIRTHVKYLRYDIDVKFIEKKVVINVLFSKKVK